MKLLMLTLLLAVAPVFGQKQAPSTPSVENSISEPAQRLDVNYRLLKTENIFTFLKLDTRTGQVWQMQWGHEQENRWVQSINTVVLGITDSRKPGRFTLYPTINMYTFILLDQDDGIQWQVCWGDSAKERGLVMFQQETPVREADHNAPDWPAFPPAPKKKAAK